MMMNRTTLCALATAVALAGGLCGYVAEAHAVDRQPFPGRSYGDAGPGYGAERQYYGAENIYRPHRGHLVRGDGYRHAYRAYGSFVDFGTGGFPLAYVPLGQFSEPSRAGVYPGFGGSSIVFYGGAPGDTQSPRPNGGAKIIDVESSRLDRQDEPKDGVSVTYVGTAKIIRISSSMASSKPARAGASRGTPLEPWSEGWARYCTRTHADFDAEHGTFTDENGRNRFCTGE